MSNSFDTEFETPEMEQLSALAENLVYQLPGCADVMIRKTLQQVYRDFCRRSCCLYGRRHFTLSHGESLIAVAPIYGGVTDTVADVTYNGRRLRTPRDYDVRMGGVPVVCFSPRWVTDETSQDDVPEITMVVTEIPAINSEKVPTWFVERYGDALTSGVLARLYAMQGRPWSDASRASFEMVSYENAINEARFRYYGDAGSGDQGFSVDTSEII